LPEQSGVRAELLEYLHFNADKPQGLLGLAMVAQQNGGTEKIEEYLERAVALDKGNAALYADAVVILSRSNLKDVAERWQLDARTRFPLNPVFPYYLALVAAENKNINNAVQLLEAAVRIDSTFKPAWYNLALLYQQQGRSQAALDARDKASN
jgi:predicted Zn-dependent protease